MVFALVLGFLVVTGGGVVFSYRGRRTATLGLTAGAAVGLVVVALSVGREGVSQFMVGTLVGLPVLIAAIAARDRRERAQLAQNLPGIRACQLEVTGGGTLRAPSCRRPD